MRMNDPNVREVLSHSDVVFGDHPRRQDSLVFPLGHDPLYTGFE